jgi:hypothetical protein
MEGKKERLRERERGMFAIKWDETRRTHAMKGRGEVIADGGWSAK